MIGRMMMVLGTLALAGCDGQNPLSPSTRLGYYELVGRADDPLPVEVNIPITGSSGTATITAVTSGSIHLFDDDRHATTLVVRIRMPDGAAGTGRINFGPGEALVTLRHVALDVGDGHQLLGTFEGTAGRRVTVPFDDPFGDLIFAKE